MIFDLIEITASVAVNRSNLRVRGMPRRSPDRLASSVLLNSWAKDSPFVMRNSLAETLAFYSVELGIQGKEIESREDYMKNVASRKDNERSFDNVGAEPPMLGLSLIHI